MRQVTHPHASPGSELVWFAQPIRYETGHLGPEMPSRVLQVIEHLLARKNLTAKQAENALEACLRITALCTESAHAAPPPHPLPRARPIPQLLLKAADPAQTAAFLVALRAKARPPLAGGSPQDLPHRQSAAPQASDLPLPPPCSRARPPRRSQASPRPCATTRSP